MDFDPSSVGLSPVFRSHVIDAWLCGSGARNQLDGASDLDITVVIDASTEITDPAGLVEVENSVVPVDVSTYTLEGFRRLVDPASLFAWHLRLEGILLTSPGGQAAQLLAGMEPFQRHSDDLAVLAQVADEAVHALSTGSKTEDFELGVLGTVVRNAALIITHYEGQPDFSRHAPARLLRHPVGLPVGLETYYALVEARKTNAGLLDATADIAEVSIGRRIIEWMSQCQEYVNRERSQ